MKFFLLVSATALFFNYPGKMYTGKSPASANVKQADTVPALARDPFTAYLTTVPSIIKVISEENLGSGSSAITIKKFTFSCRNGMDTTYGIMVYPQQPGTYPGILMLHGGGSNAEGMLGHAQSFAARGYVTLTVDQPGICGVNKAPNSSGPWKLKPPGETPRFVVTPSPAASTLADAGISNLAAFNLLRTQPNVNADKIGIMGSSWGGYSTTLLSGLLGNKVAAAYSHFGCGYYDKGSFWTNIINGLDAVNRETWLNNFDAGRRATGITGAYFIESPSNDTYFWPEAVRATMDAAFSATKNMVITPNLNHVTTASSAAMKNIYFDYYLKGTGSPFGKIIITGATKQRDGSEKISILVNMPPGIAASAVTLYYSEPAVTWQSRTWVAVNAVLESGTAYSAVIPATAVARAPDFYACLADIRTVITSSYIQKIDGSGD